ncbi:hypothetical protein QTL95_17190 [Rhizobium sp. S152]|uniref:hypothetical protein n=1 Tax=Rhizobium sp. S152 TaxID=3055038 RepID=UPI0025A985C4|nr:hypothetical protein [Rhizobium sp. S152]MDM9627640.1 hypothetical protein [Rhizobium sp. S152]
MTGSIDAGRFKAEAVETCGLCGNIDLPPVGEPDDRLPALDEAAADAIKQLALRDSEYMAAVRRSDQTKTALNNLMKATEDLHKELSAPDRSVELARDIAVVEALIKEHSAEPEDPRDEAAYQKLLAILKLATVVSKTLMDETQASTLQQVSDALLTNSEQLGVQNLEGMKLSINRLDVKQGGAEKMTFKDLAPGENLRVRVAAALAVLDVARRSGVGRHPGLLVLDSPGAQEMAAEFADLIGSIGKAVEDQPELQVIIGAVDRTEFDTVVPANRRKQAFKEDKLF